MYTARDSEDSSNQVRMFIFKSHHLLEIGQTLTWFFYPVRQHQISITRELLELSEEDKLQAAMDVAEAVYFIHNLSNPVVHQVRGHHCIGGTVEMKGGRGGLSHLLTIQVTG